MSACWRRFFFFLAMSTLQPIANDKPMSEKMMDPGTRVYLVIVCGQWQYETYIVNVTRKKIYSQIQIFFISVVANPSKCVLHCTGFIKYRHSNLKLKICNTRVQLVTGSGNILKVIFEYSGRFPVISTQIIDYGHRSRKGYRSVSKTYLYNYCN